MARYMSAGMGAPAYCGKEASSPPHEALSVDRRAPNNGAAPAGAPGFYTEVLAGHRLLFRERLFILREL